MADVDRFETPLYTLGEAGHYLGLSKTTLARWSRWRRHARSPGPTARVWSWKGQDSAPPRPSCRAASQIDQHQSSAAASLPDVGRQSDIKWRTARPITPSSGRGRYDVNGDVPQRDPDKQGPP